MRVVSIDEVGEVTIRRSPRAKRLILKIDQSGKPTVTIPSYAPYKLAERFARQHSAWFKEHLPAQTQLHFHEGMEIGRHHTLTFIPFEGTAPSARVQANRITIRYPRLMSPDHRVVQEAAAKGAIRALRRQAEQYLPPLLHTLAKTYGYSYREVRIKALQTRWGSCSSNRIINLSIWLMQLPEPLIEYVLCHEITHLEHMNHSPAFWAAVGKMIPDHKERRSALKAYSPRLLQT